jgi:hypothetical protein
VATSPIAGPTPGLDRRVSGASGGALAGGLAPPIAIPDFIQSIFDDKYINDDALEVEGSTDIVDESVTGADIADGSLTGADVSTSSGDVTHLNGFLGVGTSTPIADLHIVSAFDGRLVLGSSSSIGHSELLLGSDASGDDGVKLRYSGSQDMLAFIGTAKGETYGPHLSIDRVDGLVGIQTTSPNAGLGIQESPATPTIIRAMDLVGNTVFTVYNDGRTAVGTAILDAALAVQQTTELNSIIRAKNQVGDTVFRVFDDGRTGVGTDSPNAGLGVQESPLTSTIFRALDLAGNTVFRIYNDGRTAVGTEIVDAALAVQQTPTVTSIIRAKDLAGDTVFRVFDDGRTGVGTASPNAGLGIQEVPSTTTLLRAMDSSGATVMRVTNTGRVVCSAVEITGGGDLVEPFASTEACEPGSVVVLDVDAPGKVKLSRGSYDRCVAGVVSGAGGVRPGLSLSQRGVLEGDTPIALAGRVFVKASAENGPINVGDLLVSSRLAGHAMRATDAERSFGAVIGKALAPLEQGEGLVLVLVNLQ